MEATIICGSCWKELPRSMYNDDKRKHNGKKYYCIECENKKTYKQTAVPWTKKEEEIVINEVKNYPTNIYYAFEQASKKLTKRNGKAIAKKWYKDLRDNINVNAITTGSEKGFTKNVKNKHRDEEGNLPDQGLMHYMYVLKEILNLPQKERDIILQVFNIGNININTK